jgi:hypothetical protein
MAILILETLRGKPGGPLTHDTPNITHARFGPDIQRIPRRRIGPIILSKFERFIPMIAFRIRRPPTPSFLAAKESYAVTLRYLQQSVDPIAIYLPSALAHVQKSRKLWAQTKTFGTGSCVSIHAGRCACEILERLLLIMTKKKSLDGAGDDGGIADVLVQFRDEEMSDVRKGRLAKVVDEAFR